MKASLFLLVSGFVGTAGLLVTGWCASVPGPAGSLTTPGRAAWSSAVAEVAPGIPLAQVPDPATASAAEVQHFVARLGTVQRTQLVRLAPAAVGNLDGLPVTMRYDANAALMATRERRRTPKTSVQASLTGSRGAAVTALVKDDRAPGRTLAYDPRGDGRVVQVLGDLQTAKDIVVLVPGSKWRLDNTMRWSAGSSVTPLQNAAGLSERLGPEAAVVMWLGYDAPERIDLAAVGSGRAIPGAVALKRFLDGLPKAHLTLLCHSYGTVVCGRAVTAGARVDDLVAIGSPGLDVDRARELRTATRVWAARTADDPIRITPPVRVFGLGHGTAPTDPRFGAKVFRTGVSRGHDEYFKPGSESLANIVRIALGRPSEVTLR